MLNATYTAVVLAILAGATAILFRSRALPRLAAVGVVVFFASWAAFVWFTPIGPLTWRGSVLAFAIVGGCLAWLHPGHRYEATRTTLSLLGLFLMIPVAAHLLATVTAAQK